MEYELNTAKKTAEELYMQTPIGVLRYITALENELEQAIKVIPCCKSDSEQLKCDHDLYRSGNYIKCRNKDCDYKILG